MQLTFGMNLVTELFIMSWAMCFV